MLSYLLMLRLFFLEPNRPCINTIGACLGSEALFGGSCKSYTRGSRRLVLAYVRYAPRPVKHLLAGWPRRRSISEGALVQCIGFQLSGSFYDVGSATFPPQLFRPHP